MLESLTIMEVLKLMAPIIIIELILKIFSIYLIIKNGVKNLSKPIWIVIVLLISTFGPLAFLIFGRKDFKDD